MSSLTTRAAGVADVPLILRFVHELAEYEKARHEVEATEAHIEQALFGAGATTFAVICERDGEAVGFALYFFSYSTWTGKRGIYLEDLYVSPPARGAGAGKALLRHLARVAMAEDCARFEWAVLDWNTPAIGFYEALGARPQSEWTTYRLTGEPLAALAASDDKGQGAEGVAPRI